MGLGKIRAPRSIQGNLVGFGDGIDHDTFAWVDTIEGFDPRLEVRASNRRSSGLDTQYDEQRRRTASVAPASSTDAKSNKPEGHVGYFHRLWI